MGLVVSEPASIRKSRQGYNYAAYDFALETPELAAWLERGPRIGQAAPDFELSDLDGRAVRLSDLRSRPVVLEFGSYTCPLFSDRVPAMEQLAREQGEAVFLVIYVREAHPGENQGPHRSLAEKRSAAHKLALEEALARRVLVDTLEGATHRAYGGAWNPVYVIGSDGRVVLRQAWNHPADVAAALEALNAGGLPQFAESVDMLREPGRRPTGQRLLERGGLRALADFYGTAPAPVQLALRTSPSAAVRAAVAALGGTPAHT
jgi:thiol-disulfide isomerase/thioredoxin